jgi:crotonobetainyl-CoA:carnitine CoA-transferase CaiB-like acyl-CoA transferase
VFSSSPGLLRLFASLYSFVGVLESWGLGPDDLPDDLVMARISGYGQTGPKSHLPGYASVCEAYGGFRSINGFADRPPVRPNISLGDSLAGLHAAFGVTLSLLHRDSMKKGFRGTGQVVDAAISESIFNMMEGSLTEYVASGKVRGPSGSTITDVVPSGTWKAKDGHYVVIGGNGNSVYDRLMTAIGRSDMTTENERYATDSQRCAVEEEICCEIEKFVENNTAEAVISVMSGARVPAGMIYSVEDIYKEDQYRARGMFEEIDGITVPAMVPKLSRTPGKTTSLGKELGEDTVDVLRTRLNLSDETISQLRMEGVI